MSEASRSLELATAPPAVASDYSDIANQYRHYLKVSGGLSRKRPKLYPPCGAYSELLDGPCESLGQYSGRCKVHYGERPMDKKTIQQQSEHTLQRVGAAKRAFADFLAMGDGRSITGLHRKYIEMEDKGRHIPPTTSIRELNSWSFRYQWHEEISRVESEIVLQAEDIIKARRVQVMMLGLANDYERVAALDKLANRMMEDLLVEGKMWVSEPRAIGGGEYVDVKRFNHTEVTQIRGILDDISLETGGRQRTVKVDIEARIRSMALTLGLDADEALQEAQKMLGPG